MKKVAFHTLGCKLNFAETSAIGRLFCEQGFVTVTLEQRPHVFVVNTCSVTEHADRKCAKVVRDALRIAPNAFVAVIGCYAQLQPEAIAAIPGVDAVLGTHEKFKLLDLVAHFSKKAADAQPLVRVSPIKQPLAFAPSHSLGDRTRTFLKVQDGCNYGCTFCTIPLARGRSRSATAEEVVAQARAVAANGVKEIVLTGINLGDFGIVQNRRQSDFFRLVQALEETATVERLRISSIEPNLLSEEIIAFVAQSKRFMPHFHIPLQSGSDKILRAMRRRYATDLYRQKVDSIQKQLPHACIGVDVIVGFPGEEEEDFLETYRFLNELPVAYLHVFPYSERANTAAKELPGSVPQAERTRRARMLRILSEKKLRHFYAQQLGRFATVLFENEEKEDNWVEGYTENYVRVRLPHRSGLANTLRRVRLQALDAEGFVLPELV